MVCGYFELLSPQLGEMASPDREASSLHPVPFFLPIPGRRHRTRQDGKGWAGRWLLGTPVPPSFPDSSAGLGKVRQVCERGSQSPWRTARPVRAAAGKCPVPAQTVCAGLCSLRRDCAGLVLCIGPEATAPAGAARSRTAPALHPLSAGCDHRPSPADLVSRGEGALALSDTS